MTRLAAIVFVLTAACGDVPFPTLFVFADAANVELCCDAAGELPLVAEEFEMFATGPMDASIDTSAYKVQLDYTSTSEAVTLSLPSGSSLPLGSSTVAILVERCDFTEALLDINITLSGQRTNGATFQTGWLGTIAVTNTCP